MSVVLDRESMLSGFTGRNLAGLNNCSLVSQHPVK